MDIFIDIVNWTFLITSWMVFGYSLYFSLLSFFGIVKKKRKYPIIEDKQKFCIFIPCHNEEDVIAATVENMAKIEYNSNLVDFYIIADNCSDNTAANAKDAINALGLENFIVFERHERDKKKRGKPHALRWGIERLESEDKFYNYYDMFMIFDADNFADANILKEINSQYENEKPHKKPCMIQCYLDSKNANNIIAQGYNFSYRIVSNRMNQLSKSQLGINASIGGTGFAITTTFLKSIGGFSAKSLTEDLEMQTIANINNKYIAHNPYARAYDEKPTGVRQSYVQKTRWSQGHWYVCFHYAPRLFISLFNAKSLRLFFSKLDTLVYLLANFFLIGSCINFVCYVIALVCNFTLPPIFIVANPIHNIAMTLLFVYNLIIYPLCAIKQDGTNSEKKLTLLKMPYIYVSLLISTVIYAFAAIKGLFTWPNQTKWAKTKHVQTENTNADIAVKK